MTTNTNPSTGLREQVDKLLARAAVRSEASLATGGRSLDYQAIAEFVPVLRGGTGEQRGEPEAAIFVVSYLLRDSSPTRRPVCFAFNGGPGSSSVWLHLGALGPKRVVIHEDGTMPGPPYLVQENPHSWLDQFDLVFIDAPHTGYSTTASDEARKRAFSVDGDGEILTECIRAWLGRHKRWSSPLYLAGESYGTARGALIAHKLLESGIALSGMMLISCAMEHQALLFSPRNDLPFSLFLPAYACVAQYHGKLRGNVGASPQSARDAAEQFVVEDYLGALQAGVRLSNTSRTRIAKRLSELTGLARTTIEQANLRVVDILYFVELLRDRGRTVGRLDGRVTVPMGSDSSRQYPFDPSMDAVLSPYTMAANSYMSEHLGVDSQARYEVFSMEINNHWDFNRGGQKGDAYLCTSPDLACTLRRNAHLRVFVASGCYDLASPYSATNWSLAQLDAPAEVLARVEHRLYDSGHLLYTREADLKKLKSDLSAWLFRQGT